MPGTRVFLIPSFLSDSATDTIPPYVLAHLDECEVFFVENERTARRYIKTFNKNFNIDQRQWFTIHKMEEALITHFRNSIRSNKTIGIISEAGCPGVADPGQLLVSIAQEMDASVIPLVGPSAILLALMASGMNGQQFAFHGYLPIDAHQRTKMIKEIEAESTAKNRTQIFIETPYRNNQLLEALLKNCQLSTKLCIAYNLTAQDQFIQTKSIRQWKNGVPKLQKNPVTFLLKA